MFLAITEETADASANLIGYGRSLLGIGVVVLLVLIVWACIWPEHGTLSAPVVLMVLIVFGVGVFSLYVGSILQQTNLTNVGDSFDTTTTQEWEPGSG